MMKAEITRGFDDALPGEHIRETTTPMGSMTEGPGGTLLADCSCGYTYEVAQGPGEGDRLDAAHAAHVAEAESEENER